VIADFRADWTLATDGDLAGKTDIDRVYKCTIIWWIMADTAVMWYAKCFYEHPGL